MFRELPCTTSGAKQLKPPTEAPGPHAFLDGLFRRPHLALDSGGLGVPDTYEPGPVGALKAKFGGIGSPNKDSAACGVRTLYPAENVS